nr:CDP-glycerol glycerophosphotransferase family protein [Secundilactobacillus angelensis]
MSIFFKVLQHFTKVDQRKILFVSFSGKQYSDSPRVIYLNMKEDKRFQRFKFRWGFVNPKGIKSVSTNEKVNINSIRYYYELASSKYWISNASIERLLPINSNKHVYINTWHGIPMKMLGDDDIGADPLVTNWYRKAQIDFLTVNGKYDEQIFSEVFPRTKHMIRGGLPRNFRLYNSSVDDKQKLKDEMHLNLNKKVILYAPTFRDNPSEMEKVLKVLNKLNQNGILDKYNFLFRGHYFFDENEHLADKVINVTKYKSIEELYIVSDILISDYSSVIFDYSILMKPIILYTPDLESYQHSRGFYKKPTDLDLPIVYTAESLEALINAFLEEKENIHKSQIAIFYKKFHDYTFTSIEQIKDIILK